MTVAKIVVTKIKQLEVVKSVGSALVFCVGTTYNGLLLDRILDCSVEYQDAINSIYRGYTAENQIVFETVHAPTVAEFE